MPPNAATQPIADDLSRALAAAYEAIDYAGPVDGAIHKWVVGTPHQMLQISRRTQTAGAKVEATVIVKHSVADPDVFYGGFCDKEELKIFAEQQFGMVVSVTTNPIFASSHGKAAKAGGGELSSRDRSRSPPPRSQRSRSRSPPPRSQRSRSRSPPPQPEAFLIPLPDDAAVVGAALMGIREALQLASLQVPVLSQGGTRNRFHDFCRTHNLNGKVSSGGRRQGLLWVHLMWPANAGMSESRRALWGGRFEHVTDQDREDRALELALAAAQSAHRQLIDRGLESPPSPPRETRSWLWIGANGEFERVNMFDANQREAGWSVLRRLRSEEVRLLALDEEGSGHCSCGACTGDRVFCATTFVQVCVWRLAAKPLVVMDFWPEAKGWTQLIAQYAPTQPVATWGFDPLAVQIFGRRVYDLQREAGARIRTDLKYGPPHTGEKLGLKAAYSWVALRRGEPIYVYPKPKDVHTQPGCWQRRHQEQLLTEDRKRYAAADAYATGALFCECLRLQTTEEQVL